MCSLTYSLTLCVYNLLTIYRNFWPAPTSSIQISNILCLIVNTATIFISNVSSFWSTFAKEIDTALFTHLHTHPHNLTFVAYTVPYASYPCIRFNPSYSWQNFLSCSLILSPVTAFSTLNITLRSRSFATFFRCTHEEQYRFHHALAFSSSPYIAPY